MEDIGYLGKGILACGSIPLDDSQYLPSLICEYNIILRDYMVDA